jgi:putative flippase GtrA
MIKKIHKKLAKLPNNILSLKILKILLNNQKYRFLLMGSYNFIFNYFIGLIVFKIFVMNIWSISAVYLFNIIHNFFIHKFFSFRKLKFCHKELIRALIVNGLMYLFSSYFLLFMIDKAISQIIAYHINILVSLLLFYILHSQFTFKVKL